MIKHHGHPGQEFCRIEARNPEGKWENITHDGLTTFTTEDQQTQDKQLAEVVDGTMDDCAQTP